MPFSAKTPASGRLAIFRALKLLAGSSIGSVKPKSASWKVYELSSRRVTVLSAPSGASFTGVTSKVMVFGD